MIYMLNDDCLYLICKHLDMEDHISLSQTSERLRQIIANYYETHNKVTLDDNIWCKFPRKEKLQKLEFLAKIGSIIGPHIKELCIKSSKIETLNCLHQLPVGKITALEFQIVYLEDSDKDEVEKYLISLSAQLKSLFWRGKHLFRTIVGKKFPNVTKLHISDDYDHLNIKVEMFPALTILQLYGPNVNVPSLCELKNLTTLELAYTCLTQEQLQMIFSSLTLKKLLIYITSELSFDGISKCQTIEELGLYEKFMNVSLDELAELRNLQKISVYGAFYKKSSCKYLTEREVLELSRFNLAKKLKSLQHLKICLPDNDKTIEEGLCKTALEILKNSHSLRVFETWGINHLSFEILK